MPQSFSELDIGQLTVSQKLDLIALLWNSITDSLEGLPIPCWHLQELERRLAIADATPEAAVPWAQAKIRLRSQP